MWTRPWKYSEGFVIGAGLLLTGAALHLALGPLDWGLFSWPANLVVLAAYIVLLVILYCLKDRFYIIEWMTHFKAALPAIVYCVALTLVMGLTSWDMLGFWPFVFAYVWMTTIVGLAVIGRIAHFKAGRDIPFLLNHLGLFIALVAATLGSADVEKYDMTTTQGQPEWRALDKKGLLVDLPLAVELQQFHLDQYPPKLMLMDNATGKGLPLGQPQSLVLEDGIEDGILCDWNIHIVQNLPYAAMVDPGSDPDNFVDYGYKGACAAVQVSASRGEENVTGWVSCGSFIFPTKALKLDDQVSIVMPAREPKRYASDVKVYTEKGKSAEGTIEVNKPLKIEGYKIYQLSFDADMGEWSETSVLQIVKDPWLPVVYVGIFMLLAGAACNFVTAAKKKEEE